MTNNDQKSSVKNEFQDLINEANDYFYNTDYENNYVKAFELFIKAYEIDPANVQVLNRLADIYFYGLSGEKNTEKAFELYTQSSKLGSFEGFCGVLTYFGDMYGEDSNEKFFEFCKNMYEENPSNLEAGFQTALCYLDSIGTKKDEEYAVGLLNELVEKGCINAADVLADIYYEGSEVTCQDIKRALQLYKFAADNNNAHAQTCLGISYKDGKGVEADIKKSIEYFESAVAQNDRVAMYHLAMIYANGNGVSKDYDKAIELLTKSSDLGYSSASVQLGLLYQYGQGVEKDGKKAFELYNYAYNNGNTNIALMEFIGKCYKDGIGTDVNYEKALEFLSIASDRGEALAKYELATMYFEGKGVAENKGKAAELFSQGYELGDMLSGFRLADMLVEGDGIPKDLSRAIDIFKKINNNPIENIDTAQHMYLLGRSLYNSGEIRTAIKLFEAAEELDNEEAALALYQIYLKGEFVPKQPAKAIYYLEKFAEKGSPLAAANLGEQFLFGDEVPKDLQKAAHYNEIAANAGSIRGMNNLGIMYLNGDYFPKSIDNAEYWFLRVKDEATSDDQAELDFALQRLAYIYTYDKKNRSEAFSLWSYLAKKGSAAAQYQLGYCYATGFGTKRNRVEAFSWVQTAITNGYNGNHAYKLLNQLSSDMKYNAPSYYEQTGKHCYVATAVYGSYDCPQVWTLRRYRDYVLSKTVFGRLFIKIYYAISPLFIKMFGKTYWFNKFFKFVLDKIIINLINKGFKNTPYDD